MIHIIVKLVFGFLSIFYGAYNNSVLGEDSELPDRQRYGRTVGHENASLDVEDHKTLDHVQIIYSTIPGGRLSTRKFLAIHPCLHPNHLLVKTQVF